jgi:hypothetical protein
MHDSLNFAALHRLPVIFVCENNEFSVYTRLSEKQPVRIASPDHPVPTSHFMSESYYPDSLAIADAVLNLAGIRQNATDYTLLKQSVGLGDPLDVPNKIICGSF